MNDTTKASARHIALLLGLCGAVFFVGLGSRDLWRPDEPRIAEISREMVERDDWIILYENDKLYAQKPPLTYWAVAGMFRLAGGPNVLAARIPSALATTGCVILTYLLACGMFSRRAGLLSACVLATSIEMFLLGTRISIDTLLCFWFLGIFASLWRFQVRREHGLKWLYLAFALAGLAVLTKGLIGIVLPVGVAGAYLLWDRASFRPRVRWLIAGAVLALVIAVPWGAATYVRVGSGYMEEFIVKHHFQRAAGLSTHLRPFYYYFLNFPSIFLPWVVFLPGACLYLFRTRADDAGPSRFKFLMAWFVVFFVFFSISSSKRELYLLPVLPATAIMVGHFLSRQLDGSQPVVNRKWFVVPIYLILGMLFVAALAGPVVGLTRFRAVLPGALALTGILLIGGTGSIVWCTRQRWAPVLTAIVVTLGATYATASVTVFPRIDSRNSLKPFSREVMDAVGPHEEVKLFWTVKHAFLFYASRTAEEITDSKDFDAMMKSNCPGYVVMRKKHLEGPNESGAYRLKGNDARPYGIRIVVEDRSKAGLVLVTGTESRKVGAP